MNISCSRCSQRAICRVLCPEIELIANKDFIPQRERPIGIPMFGEKIQEIWGQKKFTFRERQILGLMFAGLDRQNISQSLNITRETLKTHLYRINQKVETKVYTT